MSPITATRAGAYNTAIKTNGHTAIRANERSTANKLVGMVDTMQSELLGALLYLGIWWTPHTTVFSANEHTAAISPGGHSTSFGISTLQSELMDTILY